MHRTKLINFRASPQLVEVLTATARAEGVTVSDVVRQAVEDRVAQAPNPPALRAAFDPYGKLSSAARGSLQAQRDMAREAVRLAFETGPDGRLVNDPETTLLEGLVFARLAAAQGDIGDQGTVISMIALLAEVIGEEAAGEQMAEAIARISMIADLGDSQAADALPGLVASVSHEIAADVSEFAARIKDEVFGHAAE